MWNTTNIWLESIDRSIDRYRNKFDRLGNFTSIASSIINRPIHRSKYTFESIVPTNWFVFLFIQQIEMFPSTNESIASTLNWTYLHIELMVSASHRYVYSHLINDPRPSISYHFYGNIFIQSFKISVVRAHNLLIKLVQITDSNRMPTNKKEYKSTESMTIVIHWSRNETRSNFMLSVNW